VTAIWYSGTNAGPAMGTPLVAWLTTVYGWRSRVHRHRVARPGVGRDLAAGVPSARARPLSVGPGAHQNPGERDSALKTETGQAVGYRGLLLETPTLWGLAITQAASITRRISSSPGCPGSCSLPIT